MEATVTIICGMILAFQAAWITYRLKMQDNARDAARAEMRANAETVKEEALAAAANVENKVIAAAALTSDQLGEIQIKVDGRLSEALSHIRSLEEQVVALKAAK